ncbi:LacI family transcriptional regulator [Amycolatopsis echigonensis]|uniref:LacI family transcriptional regulator n=1 Tax=Amycolatopsis echigonensis TaxID=2576905 RepID=A0A2N3X1X4_9PSEU|nr:GntR family transcriptional regulator [Amycolatopsis niigatensis]PKW00121.1 LacI family transcriptional regulator [Amycolatopsis niigatensis]
MRLHVLDDRSGRIDHDGPEYVWAQIADDIRRDIESGALPAGSKLAGGRKSAEIYGVAKASAAKAITALRHERVVTVVLGCGTFATRNGQGPGEIACG